MNVITYSLRATPRPDAMAADSDVYYRDVAVFTGQVMAETERLLGPVLDRHVAQAEASGDQPARSRQEYGFELLILGTLWRIYSGDASVLEPIPRQFLQALVELRREAGFFKPGIDLVRGVLSTVFLAPDLYDHLFMLATDPVHLEKLLSWLEASGEFNEESRRLRRWQAWMARQPAEDAVGVLAGCLSLAAWFEAASETALGAYTAGVGRYLQEKRPQRYWQEDVIFCGRRRVEYHLNMVGAEIMNRSLRADFLATQKKAVVLPACLRLRRAEECRAQDAGSHLVCTACLADCPVAVLTRAGKKGGFAVLMVPHESSLSAARTDSSFLSPDVGVVGIACVLNLIAGGWMLRRKGIATQCVLLDWCGCKKHWSDEGRPTAINLGQLMRVLDLAGRS